MVFYIDKDSMYHISVVERKRTDDNPAMAKISILDKTQNHVPYGFLYQGTKVEIFEEIQMLLYKVGLRKIKEKDVRDILELSNEIYDWLNNSDDSVLYIDPLSPNYLQQAIAYFTEVIYAESDV